MTTLQPAFNNGQAVSLDVGALIEELLATMTPADAVNECEKIIRAAASDADGTLPIWAALRAVAYTAAARRIRRGLYG